MNLKLYFVLLYMVLVPGIVSALTAEDVVLLAIFILLIPWFWLAGLFLIYATALYILDDFLRSTQKKHWVKFLVRFLYILCLGIFIGACFIGAYHVFEFIL